MVLRDTVPIVVGVTGHRDIRPEDRDALCNAVEKILLALREKCPHSGIVMLNSLARSADQLCAEAALKLSIPLTVVLPMAQEEYEKDFSGEELLRFRTLCGAAKECFIAPETEQAPLSPDRDFAYRQAGIFVAAHAHVLLALWDGDQTAALSCGTAETVGFALEGAYEPKNAIPLGGNCPVWQVRTPRSGAEGEGAGKVRFLGDEAAFELTLARTDEFNKLAGQEPRPQRALLPAEREPDECLDRLETLYEKADALSIRFAERYRRLLAALAVISTVITVAFLLYDEAELHWMILVCGAMLLLAWILQRRGKRIASHRRYLEYRMLAEGMRVQAFLRYAGRGGTVADILPWSAKTEAGWVAAALNACAAAGAPKAVHAIRDVWVEQQRRYHEKAIGHSGRAFRSSERIVGAALRISIGLYFAVLVFEAVWGGLLPFSRQIAEAEKYRTLSKLLLGSVSAAALFISHYYGRLSLSRVTSDHVKMERFYRTVRDRIDRFGETPGLLCLIAREELTENVSWCSYQRDNTAHFDL
ncbi:MAG: DUF4231 domain-containing protein [Lachnospiraceae bacterium]|nr:DUF4231 domain-containing protein [Lachnospiraceae bacterium]